ncbi:Biofilm regulator 1 [Elsinoe fawcettii]|nr:Biofilm regulator 1 [Elsinoe fawcettii]
MEAPNASRPALPPIQFLDSDKIRREEVDYQSRHGEAPPTNGSSSIVNAPYPQGPPPPYSASAQHPNPTPTATPHSQTPDILSKRAADLKDGIKHSLPSLHEALGVERHANYSSEGPASATTQTAHATPQTHSPQSPRRYHVGPSPPHRPQSFAPVHPPYSQSESAAPRSAPAEPQEFRRPEYAESYRTYQHRSPPSTSSHRGSYPGPEPVRAFEPSPQGPAPPSSQFTYGYAHSSTTPYTSGPPAPTSAAPIFHPSTIPHTSPETSHSWRSGPTSVPAPRPVQAYSESVKRHLDLYDFEMALNEIAEHSTIMHDFSRQYGARLHQTQRSGPTPGTLPAITEIDDLMSKTRHTLESLGRLREGLVAHQTAYFQQAQENLRLSQDAKRNDSVHQHDDSKAGGFAGAEPKKRRGRNAAPGRCHSCNRAETPEWRRGPDGARTLCNACGLHYAKLTRKAGANKAAIGSSSLRPKSKEDNE